MDGFKIIEKPVKGKVCVLVGTRPGIIRMTPLIKELGKKKANFFVIHGGQHYSYEMDKIFFEDLELPEPQYKLEEVKNYTLHGEQTAEMLKGIERILVKEKPEIILVCGDANVNLAGALAARKLRIKIGHVEAGLRSNDWRMPEEHNRVIIDHISEYLFAPTEHAKQNALIDNVNGKVFITGNTIVDALMGIKEIALRKSSILDKLSLEAGKYFILTAHREENVDNILWVKELIQSVMYLSNEYSGMIVWPIHPRTKKRIRQFGFEDEIKSIHNLMVIDPVGYLDFIQLLSNAMCILTDSGGAQLEACILSVPCVTLRESTEWNETLEIGCNILSGPDKQSIQQAIKQMLYKDRVWTNPFGDGSASRLIIDIVLDGTT